VEEIHLIDHRHHISGTPPPTPEIPLRAEAAPIGAPPAGQQSGESPEHRETIAPEGAVRISIGPFNTEEDIDHCIEAIREIATAKKR